jgi:serine/threonine-protein kinase
MEHLSGGTFADRMSAERPHREEILRWLGEAASALDFAHEKGVVHRDVKPRNLLFDDRARLVVADFGIARAAFEDSLTASGELLGTAAYIAPEQVSGGAATPASDRYALAVVAYEALTGGLPFGGGTLIEIATKRSQGDPPRPSERSPELPPAVDDVMMRALHADPAQRWPSATEFVEALERALAQGAPPMAVQRMRPRRSVPVAAILLGLAAIAIGTIVGLTVLRDDSGGGTRADGGRATTADRGQQTTKRQQPAPAQTQAQSPATLNDQGFQLMNAGRYDDAIPVLQRAVAAFPADSTELTYAYALYNLGRSLRLAGRAGEAIPILERRLQFANQRGVVKRELAAARRAAEG